jgi:hypothetical protein
MKCYPHLPQDVHSVLVISWTEKKKKKVWARVREKLCQIYDSKFFFLNIFKKKKKKKKKKKRERESEKS